MRWMTMVCLFGGAVVIGWPGRARARRRLRAPEPVRRWSAGPLRAAVRRRPRRALLGAVALASALAAAAGGPVAGVVAAVYTGLLGRALIRRATGRRSAAARSAALDELAALAADLRAGLPAAAAAPVLGSGSGAGRIGRLTTSVWRLAEETGAPAADLVERIEADARAADRARAAAAAQAAGAQATTAVLAALPLLGLGLGMAMGADPLHVLLGTPLGAGCAVVAVLLQAGGLLWTERLAAGAVR